MGWGSAGYRIFDPVMQGLIEAGASAEIKQRVADGLIDVLQENDWDTEYDSLEQFSDDEAIVEAFAEHGITLGGDDDE